MKVVELPSSSLEGCDTRGKPPSVGCSGGCRAPTSARPHMREKQHGGLGGVNAELGQAKELRY